MKSKKIIEDYIIHAKKMNPEGSEQDILNYVSMMLETDEMLEGLVINPELPVKGYTITTKEKK